MWCHDGENGGYEFLRGVTLKDIAYQGKGSPEGLSCEVVLSNAVKVL